jgi:hypothetical protein
MRGLLAKQWGEIYQGPKTHGLLEGDVWTSQISLWLMRECCAYWKTRNEERETTSSRKERDKPRALANGEAGVRQLYSREMEVGEADRGIFAVPVVRRLQLSLPAMQQWVKTNREMLNMMVSQRERREAENQPDIRIAVTTVITEEMEQASRAIQDRRQERPKPPATPTRRKNTAAETAQLRAARPKVCMLERLMGGYSALNKKKEEEKNKKTKRKQPNKQRQTRQHQRRKRGKTRTSPQRQEKSDRTRQIRTQ